MSLSCDRVSEDIFVVPDLNILGSSVLQQNSLGHFAAPFLSPIPSLAPSSFFFSQNKLSTWFQESRGISQTMQNGLQLDSGSAPLSPPLSNILVSDSLRVQNPHSAGRGRRGLLHIRYVAFPFDFCCWWLVGFVCLHFWFGVCLRVLFVCLFCSAVNFTQGPAHIRQALGH